MKNLVKWGRSKDGQVESKCKKYDIEPLPWFNSYSGYYCPGRAKAKYAWSGWGLRACVGERLDTQREVKEAIEKHARGIEDERLLMPQPEV